jgi:hypothetical protein
MVVAKSGGDVKVGVGAVRETLREQTEPIAAGAITFMQAGTGTKP